MREQFYLLIYSLFLFLFGHAGNLFSPRRLMVLFEGSGIIKIYI